MSRARRSKLPGVAPATAIARNEVVDAARGFSVAMMIAYHVCFDLTYYGWTTWRMLDDAGWIAWRSAIVTCFVFLVGVSLALRDGRDRAAGATTWLDRVFLRRWLQVAGAALLVTIGSAALFPATFIYFGVLHFVAVALWLCRRAPRLGAWSIGLGAVVLAMGFISGEAFDPRVANWIGFAARKPLTEDYVPLVPWMGVVLIGCGLGAAWIRHDMRLSWGTDVAWNAVPRPVRKALAALGRWSLTIYLVHQPLLIGTLGLVKRFG